MTNLQELLSKPVWQMTGEEFIFLSKHASGQTDRIKKSGKIDKAITQIGRKIIVDVELALELAGKKTGGRK